MHEERMKQLIEKIQLVPDVHFDLDFFTHSWSNSDKGTLISQLFRVGTELTPGDCGAVGCVAGFCPVFFPDEFDYVGHSPYILPRYKKTGRTGFSAMEDFLYIDTRKAEYLFDPSDYKNLDGYRYITKSQVIERMKDVLKNGFPDSLRGLD